MRKLLNFLLLSCKRYTLLVEQQHQKKLSVVKSVQLKVHASICKTCSEYAKQSKMLEEIMKVNDLEMLSSTDVKLSDASKQKMAEKLKNH